MLALAGLHWPAIHSFRQLRVASRYSSSVAKTYDPLKILFCGSDQFSINSLRALYKLHRSEAQTIASIDVVCRPDKRVGRGLKKVQAVPIKSVATELSLSLHQIDTFTGWTPPRPYNLVVAVSFGLLVPPRILNAAKYGGLNVHPSLLPDLRGPAPIVHTLLKRRQYCGVSLQTMHPKHFDQGIILAQTPQPGLPVPQSCHRPDELIELLSPLGADMLRRTVEDGIFVPPHTAVRENAVDEDLHGHAPKLSPVDRQIQWSEWSANEIVLRGAVLSDLWDTETHARCKGLGDTTDQTRVTFHGPFTVVGDSELSSGTPVLVKASQGETKLGIVTADGRVVCPQAATIAGEKALKGLPTMINALRKHSSHAIE